ncbi:glycoside hydrolase family 25 protein [Paxillus involutus ATCC 200175]|uniref:N,O-diacetylmuramidase n=1 Tax=Paxillus involutus ATCC 200175 TaxID=664439 RepID=A0A0C9TXE2_PAXIN|nr:glycoside hydrolase family 25 protein [Paxillus involutus ATCC 200175]
MKYLVSLALALAVAGATPVKHAHPRGIDVSSYQPNVDWTTVKNNGIEFAYIKATEGTSYISPTFNSQHASAKKVGLIHGGYHFAHPNVSTGATQAKYFLAHGGAWSGDGVTLPGALDIEYNPSGPKCYGLSAPAMVSWIKDFSNTYKAATGRYPVIYTTTDWWKDCTGNSATFGSTNPLWIAHYASTIGTLPAGWKDTSFWQYAHSGPNPGNANLWNGDMAGLKRYTFFYLARRNTLITTLVLNSLAHGS